MESFEDQWDEVATMTENCPFVTGRPVIQTSGSMSTVKEGFFRRYVLSLFVILLGMLTVGAIICSLAQRSDNENFITFLVLLLGLLFVSVGIYRMTVIRRICWNENAGCIYLHYGWIWNRHIFQIPRGSVRIKMFVAGEKKWSSHFYHGDTILSLKLKNRDSAFPIHLLANSGREAISHIVERLSSIHIAVEDSGLVEETTSDGRTIRFPKTGIGNPGSQFPFVRLSLRKKQGQIIIGRFAGFGIAKVIIDSHMSAVVIRRSLSKCVLIMFEEVAGIQVCPRHVEDGEGDCTVFELNLVIQDSADVIRIHLLADKDNERIMSYAQQIATAMDKPIYDHGMIKKKTLADTIIL